MVTKRPRLLGGRSLSHALISLVIQDMGDGGFWRLWIGNLLKWLANIGFSIEGLAEGWRNSKKTLGDTANAKKSTFWTSCLHFCRLR